MSQETIDNIFGFGLEYFSGEIWMSLVVMLAIIILTFVIYFKFKNADPTKANGGFVLVVELLIEKLEDFTIGLMGKKNKKMSGYFLAVAMYILFSFLIGLLGLPGPLTYLGCTFSLALCTFALIHWTAIKKNKLGYFKRFVEPLPILLPINLLSMWAPLLSLSLRLFGNALAGFTLMSIIYFALGNASMMAFGWLLPSSPIAWSGLILPPLVTPLLHVYFDLFAGAIQTLIFCMLSMIFISQEDPDEEEIQSQVDIKN